MKFYRNKLYNDLEWKLDYIIFLWAHMGTLKKYMTQQAHFVEKLCDRTGALGPKIVRQFH